ncbi:45409_t:CDS:1, partial [Gigaspora margarita]
MTSYWYEMNTANFSNNRSESMLDMEQYIFFDGDAKCSTTNANNTSSSFYDQNDEIQKCNEIRDKMKTSSISKSSVSNMNETSTTNKPVSTIDEPNYSNNQDEDEFIDRLNIDLEEQDNGVSDSANNE